MSAYDFYETERALAEYLLFHYGSAEQILPWTFGPATALNYPARCVSECLEIARLPGQARALDLGCAVGRSTFELARHCSEVVGIDYSHRFIEVARHLQQHGSMPYAYVEEGHLTTPTTAVVPAEIDRHRVTFEQGDAQALRPDLGSFLKLGVAADVSPRILQWPRQRSAPTHVDGYGVSPWWPLAAGGLACGLLVRYRGQRVVESAPE